MTVSYSDGKGKIERGESCYVEAFEVCANEIRACLLSNYDTHWNLVIFPDTVHLFVNYEKIIGGRLVAKLRRNTLPIWLQQFASEAA